MQEGTTRQGASVPHAWLDGCIAAHRRIEALIEGLPDVVARRPSRLEGWSVGHVLTHLARNADANSGVVEAAQRGELSRMYPGGREQRDGAIEAGAGRPAAELLADLKAAHQRLERAWTSTSNEQWATALGERVTAPGTLPDFVLSRWREVEVHLIDLGLQDRGGPDWDDLPPAYIDLEWPITLAGIAPRVPDELLLILVPGDRPSKAFGKGSERVVVRGTPGRLLGWLMGRGGDPTWPKLGAWQY
jgi:maleylpyruvate isomerase